MRKRFKEGLARPLSEDIFWMSFQYREWPVWFLSERLQRIANVIVEDNFPVDGCEP